MLGWKKAFVKLASMSAMRPRSAPQRGTGNLRPPQQAPSCLCRLHRFSSGAMLGEDHVLAGIQTVIGAIC